MNENIVQIIAGLIYDDFENYLFKFQQVTIEAQQRFENQNWVGIQQDSKTRLNLYKSAMAIMKERILFFFPDHKESRDYWKDIKKAYIRKIQYHPAGEIAETFYNSVYCGLYDHHHISEDTMFVFRSYRAENAYQGPKIYRQYEITSSLADTLTQVLKDLSFRIPFENLERDVQNLSQAFHTQIPDYAPPHEGVYLEFIHSIFYRNKAAYIVGRVQTPQGIIPFIFPLLNENGKIWVDTLITNANTVSILFSFTRSYFLVDTKVPSEIIRFLKTLIPLKLESELYNSIGYSKHGKTEFYRDFTRSLANSEDEFIVAPGTKGMVMTVFTLLSYNVVFKVIRDRFDPPKNISHEEVKEKYRLVSRHDRVGRMADTHEFSNFIFDKDRFSEELIEELIEKAPSKIKIEGDKILINHLYTERRMTPLNLYLESSSESDAEIVIKDYGEAIKQIAAANIFPGDMLLKNFGVTRHQRVIFYDYDEICFLTDVNFRTIPEARYEEDEMSSEPWYSVGPDDVFPEEFMRFLIGRREIRKIFQEQHSEIFTAKFWRGLQNRLTQGEIMDVFPYGANTRFPL